MTTKYIYLLLKICITCYIYIYNSLLYFLPKYLLLSNCTHTNNNQDYDVNEYLYKDTICNRTFKFKFINTREINFDININEKDIENLNLINHCCIINSKDDYIRDITSEIKKFIHLNNKIEWVYILIHLNIHDDIILINMNDDDLSEKKLDVNDLIKNGDIFSI
jgi:hypothetical protein